MRIEVAAITTAYKWLSFPYVTGAITLTEFHSVMRKIQNLYIWHK